MFDVPVMVVGDVMLDRHVHGHVRRISPEAPVPVVSLAGEVHTPGGAGNVAATLAGLGARVTLAGLVGADAEGAQLRDALHAKGVSQLARDGNAAHQLLGAGVGYLSGAGRVYVGDLTSPQGSQPASVVSEAASNGHATVSATVVGPTSASGSRSDLYALADLIINSVRWPR